ncbi:tetratricopeptide repeat protein [Leptothoe sp. PORK10 BA2]|uniref:tetratricopeptide repeat protein n=1 Tax=Leptothoe sp. PORK10 BA2 TaxID=3110254 RepID=UPI002B1FBFC0|nr:tetratricopeptide repeat protein [Leptothoe sp. PORK10 BA2]MEA5463182.1 tetratricopeptide repeat protein [Leptothoe sp. PORK10 BA2]
MVNKKVHKRWQKLGWAWAALVIIPLGPGAEATTVQTTQSVTPQSVAPQSVAPLGTGSLIPIKTATVPLLEPAFRQSLAQTPTRLAQAPDIMDVPGGPELNAEGLTLYEQGRFQEALIIFEQLLALRQQQLTADNPLLAVALNNVAEVNRVLGNFDLAEPMYLQALELYGRSFPEDHPELATPLNNLGLIYLQLGRYGEAEPLFQQVIAILEKAGVPGTLALTYNNLGELYRNQGRYDLAVDYYQRSIQQTIQSSGADAPDVGLASGNLGLAEQQRGNYAAAEELFLRAIDIYRNAFGETHPNLAQALLNLGNLYQVQGRYEEVEDLYQKALAIQVKAYGEQHPAVLYTLGSFGALYQLQGRYDEAEAYFQDSLALAQQFFGSESLPIGSLLNRLGELYRLAGRLAEAEATGLKALNLQAKTLGENHPEYAGTLNNLGLVYTVQGRYREAAPRLEQAVTILENTLGPDHPSLALVLNNWAELYRTQGNYDAALPLYERALTIQIQALQPLHPELATTLNNMALLAYGVGDYDRAIEWQTAALASFETNFGGEHPHVGLMLNNLGEAHRIRGDLPEATTYLERALTVQQKVFPNGHPETALTLNNLGLLSGRRKQYDQAEAYFLEALAIMKTTLGEKHPRLTLLFDNLARLYYSQGQPQRSMPYLNQSLEVENYNLNLMLSTGSEAAKAAFFNTLPLLDSYVSFHLTPETATPGGEAIALQAILQRKGRVLEAVTDGLQALRQGLEPEDQALLDQWGGVRSQLATLVVSGIGALSPEEYQAKINALEAQSSQLETSLGNRSSQFRQAFQEISLENVQRQIPEDGALVEFVAYNPIVFDQEGAETFGELRYAAYVLKPSGEIAWRDLGEAVAIDNTLTEFRQLLQTRSQRLKPVARQLYDQLFAPLAPELAGVDHLLLAPDGQLNLIPFAALVDEDGGYLLEDYHITYLTSGRDLLRLDGAVASRQAPVLMANPDYDNAVQTAEQTLVATTSNRGSGERAADLTSLRFGPLAGTAVEAEEISQQLAQVTLLTGAQATENSLKGVQGPSILHIATHGFFLKDQETFGTSQPSFRGAEEIGTGSLSDPLLRSGLALAGFNQRSSGSEDGVLTALEAANLNLHGTQLVVLSACETGVGEVRNGAGVYGLRRAFVMAGAQTQILSLWQVNDLATKDLMVGYYQQLQANRGRSEALREIQLAMLDGEYEHPYYWAAFIPSGDWTPMQ